jgi:hypothetical protein
MEAPDFGGYATKAGLKCSDGRTITPEAFQHMNGKKVPLVWQHGHNDPENVLGHVMLEARNDGVYAHGFFNNTKSGQNAKALVEHKDINALSIYANQLVERAKSVFHGMIKEVSLVLSGANPGALIDFVAVQHSDGGTETLDDEAVIYTGLVLEHGDRTYGTRSATTTQELRDGQVVSTTKNTSERETTVSEGSDQGVPYSDLEHAKTLVQAAKAGKTEKTVKDVYDSLGTEEKNVVNYLIGVALEGAGAKHSDDPNGEGDLTHKEGSDVVTNVFEKNNAPSVEKHTLSHDDMKGIVADAIKIGSLKEAVEGYALKHGIENIEVMFPDAKNLTDRPEFNKRRTEWVAGVLNGTRHTPFSRVKSLVADLTFEDARAKGYIKGTLKKEEFFSVSKRVTTPTTIYKKQKLDRDDMVDITDFDVVAWLKMEMRMMLEEELARAILIGDGRAVDDEDKIKDPAGATEGAGIRAIANEHELYATTVNVNLSDASSDYNEAVEAVLRARRYYKGTGMPTLYTTEQYLVEMLLSKDGFGRRRWNNTAELATALRVADVVAVEVMEDEEDLFGIVVNLSDYNIGADRGGEVNLFDDFDIDYNQYKYLIETRVSGALVKIKSALIIRKVAAADVLVDPITEPTFVESTGVVTIPTQTGVIYTNEDTGATLSAGAQAALAAGATLNVLAVPDTNYYFATNAQDEWSFTRPAA